MKIQKVEAGGLSQVLAQKKQADLNNKEVIISAKSKKQTGIIDSEGNRDRMIREAEGEAQQAISRGMELIGLCFLSFLSSIVFLVFASIICDLPLVGTAFRAYPYL